MAILFQTSVGDSGAWVGALQDLLPHDEFRVWTGNAADLGDPADIDIAIVWDIPLEVLNTLPNLRAMLLLGAGGSHLRPVEELPKVPIARLADPAVAHDMAAYAMAWVLHFHRNLDRYAQQQTQQLWKRHSYPPPANYTVGILGLGNIGGFVADAAHALGYAVRGWSRSGRSHPNATTFGDQPETPDNGLGEFLSGTDALVNVLPLTPATKALVGASELNQLRPGACVINMGRGATFDDEGLIDTLDSGHLSGAVLDVFRREPLGSESPLWTHPKIVVTPHISGSTFPRTSAPLLAANVERVRSGEDPHPLFDPTRGY